MRDFILFALFTIPCTLACLVPEDGMRITENVTLCSKVYYLSEGLHIEADHLTLDCNHAILKGRFIEKGIWIEHHNDITVRNCNVLNFRVGLFVHNSTNVSLFENHLIKNVAGVQLVNSQNNVLWNRDVSLKGPLLSLNSENNYITFPNKKVSDYSCTANHCNKQRSVIDRANAQVKKPERLLIWLKDMLS